MFYLTLYSVLPIYFLSMVIIGTFFFLYTSAYLFYFFSTLYFITFTVLALSRFFYFISADTTLFTWAFGPTKSIIGYSIEFNPLVSDFSTLLLFLTIIIHFYSYTYFKKDPELGRFSVLLGLFVFSMLLMINATSFVFIFIAWEGVGLFSFLLVAFWHTKVATFKSGVKVLFYNRVGDFFFFLLVGVVISLFKVDHIGTVQSLLPYMSAFDITIFGTFSLKFFLSFCLTIVILSKSAQYGFHIWLLEAMEAPLPASALIHSATLICSGVVLFFKAPEIVIFQSEISLFILFWSSLTVCFLSFSAFYNYDIKRILAYSTGSHVSLMLGLAVTSSSKLGYLYMLTHASTKVFIFILFGYIIDMTGGVRDLRKMGGFFINANVLVLSTWGLALLSSLPLFFLPYMKDAIITKGPQFTFLSDTSYFFLMLSSVFNYFYISRLFFKIFFGDRLSFLKTYYSLFFYSKPFFVYREKNFLLKTWNTPVFYLFFYILFLESNFFIFFDYNYMNLMPGAFNFDTGFISNPTLKYLAFSNTFFYLLVIFFFFKLFV